MACVTPRSAISLTKRVLTSAAAIVALSAVGCSDERVDINDRRALDALAYNTSIVLSAPAYLCQNADDTDCKMFAAGDGLVFEAARWGIVGEHAIFRMPYDHKQVWWFDRSKTGKNAMAIATGSGERTLTYENVTAEDWGHVPRSAGGGVYMKAERLYKEKIRAETIAAEKSGAQRPSEPLIDNP